MDKNSMLGTCWIHDECGRVQTCAWITAPRSPAFDIDAVLTVAWTSADRLSAFASCGTAHVTEQFSPMQQGVLDLLANALVVPSGSILPSWSGIFVVACCP